LHKRSPHIRIPKLPKDWPKVSSSNPRNLPFNLLETSERRFLKSISGRSLFSKEDLLDLLHECFGSLVGNLSDDSLGRNLYSGECYADREYYDSDGFYLGAIRVFRLGLVVAVPMPTLGSRFKHWFCYPSGPSFRLLRTNYTRPFPPHDPFASWCFRALQKKLTEEECTGAGELLRKIPHWYGNEDYVADNCLRFRVDGHWEYFWFEVHTGSEKYDESVFIPRLLTAEQALHDRGKYVVIVPFKRDLDAAFRAIKKYNLLAEIDEAKPILNLKVSEIITYQSIDHFREKLGFYNHKLRV